jgi:dihydroorotase-like cyclic amidohydrolase
MAPGQRELTLFDPGESEMVNGASLRSLSQNTQWLGRTIQGRAAHSATA